MCVWLLQTTRNRPTPTPTSILSTTVAEADEYEREDERDTFDGDASELLSKSLCDADQRCHRAAEPGLDTAPASADIDDCEPARGVPSRS
jgi:hypothetical protein